MLSAPTRAILTPLIAVLAAITLLLAPALARAQVSVRVDAPEKMYVGDTSDLQVVVTGSRNVEAPDLSALRDFEAIYRAPQDMSSTMTTIINGRMDTRVNITYSHLYAITPRHAGKLEIPPLTVLIDGRAYTTQPVVVEVAEPTAAADFKLQLIAEPASAFVGQPIHVRYVWVVGKPVESVQLGMPITGVDHDTIIGPETAQLNQRDQRAVQVRLSGEPVNAIYQNSVLTIDRIIVPNKAGVLTIGPARADFLAVTGQRPRGPLDAPWDNRNITERQFSTAPSIVIPVTELPSEGKPANFSGLVGAYSIAASADAANVSVGDPINLSIGITGPYPLSLVPPLDLLRQSTLKKNFRVPREPALPQVTSAAAAFSTMIRARNAEVNEIGPISLSYFDPDAKQYRTASTKPIPITVRASSAITLPDEPDAPTADEPTQAKRPGGLPDIDRSPVYAGSTPFDLALALREPSTLVLLLAPPLFCAVAAGAFAFRRWRERDPAAARRRAAFAQLRRSMKHARPDSLDDIARALSNFAADSFDQPRDTLTGTTAATLLSDSNTPAGSQLADLLLACDETRFGESSVPAVNRSARTLMDQALAAARAFAGQFSQQARRAAA